MKHFTVQYVLAFASKSFVNVYHTSCPFLITRYVM